MCNAAICVATCSNQYRVNSEVKRTRVRGNSWCKQTTTKYSKILLVTTKQASTHTQSNILHKKQKVFVPHSDYNNSKSDKEQSQHSSTIQEWQMSSCSGLGENIYSFWYVNRRYLRSSGYSITKVFHLQCKCKMNIFMYSFDLNIVLCGLWTPFSQQTWVNNYSFTKKRIYKMFISIIN